MKDFGHWYDSFVVDKKSSSSTEPGQTKSEKPRLSFDDVKKNVNFHGLSADDIILYLDRTRDNVAKQKFIEYLEKDIYKLDETFTISYPIHTMPDRVLFICPEK